MQNFIWVSYPARDGRQIFRRFFYPSASEIEHFLTKFFKILFVIFFLVFILSLLALFLAASLPEPNYLYLATLSGLISLAYIVIYLVFWLYIKARNFYLFLFHQFSKLVKKVLP